MESRLLRPRVKDHLVEVIEVTDLTPWYRRLTMDAKGLFEKYTPDPAAYLQLNIPDGTSTLPRSYTLHGVTPTTFQLEFVAHTPSGPGCDWARNAQPGTTITVDEPPYCLNVPQVSHCLIIADSSAFAAAQSLLETLDESIQISVVCIDDHPDHDQIPFPPRASITWLDTVGDDDLEIATARMDPTDCFLWAAGERHLAKTVREFVRADFPLHRGSHHIQTYWIAQGFSF